MSKSEDKRKAIQGGIGSAEGAEMVVDIVTRRRKELPCWCDATPTRIEVSDMCWEASAEIERLRQELADWKRTVRALEAELAEEVSGYE